MRKVKMIKIIYTCLPPKNIKMISEGEELIMNNKCKKDTMKGNKKKNKSKILPNWEKFVDPTYSTLPSSDEREQSDMLIEKLDGKSPIEIFEMIMDENIVKLWIFQKNMLMTTIAMVSSSLKPI